MEKEPTADGIVSLLAGGDRLRVVAALVLGADNLTAIAEATGIPQDRVSRAVARLLQGGLVEQDRHGLRFREEAVRSLARRPRQEDPEPGAQSLRAFVKDGRLTAIPSSHSKRLQILDLIAQDFEIGVRYSERGVKDILLRWHPDYAALRRYLVDEGFLQRQGGGGSYWRSGGTVEV
ncbi:MAG: DUF2087 domain-containing protein [Acidimicrobiales bacterium]